MLCTSHPSTCVDAAISSCFPPFFHVIRLSSFLMQVGSLVDTHEVEIHQEDIRRIKNGNLVVDENATVNI